MESGTAIWNSMRAASGGRTIGSMYLTNRHPVAGLRRQGNRRSDDDQLRVRLGDTQLGEKIALTDEAWFFESFATKCLTIPQQLRNRSQTLTFEILPGGGSTDAEVLVDNLRFVNGDCAPGAGQPVHTKQALIRPNQQHSSTVVVDASTKQLQAKITWPGSDLDLELERLTGL